MRLRKLIGEIGAQCDRLSPASGPAQRLLRQAETVLKQRVPAGYLVASSGGDSDRAVPFCLSVLNPAETTTTRRGMHVAYLIAKDKSTVTLALLQGVDELAEHLGQEGAQQVLARQAATIRLALSLTNIADLDTANTSALGFEQARIVSRTYRLVDLPREPELIADLHRFLELYTLAIDAREMARRHGQWDLIAPSRSQAATAVADPTPASAAPPVIATSPAAIEPAAQAAPDPAPATPKADSSKASDISEGSPVKEPVGSADTVTGKQSPAAEKPAPADTEPENPLEVLAPAGRKPKALAGTLTRRGVLAALIVAPIAYAAPRSSVFRSEQAAPQEAADLHPPFPAHSTPMFTVDVSQHDWKRRGGNLDWAAIRNCGIAGMCARATYGDPSGYQWPTHHFGTFIRSAKQAGMSLRGAYHNLVRGDEASINRQVDWLRREMDRYGANWAMLDVERYGELVKAEMWPRWEDVRRFDDRWAQVDGRVLVGYIPPWNWSKHLGQPDLRDFRGPLIASNYPRQANEEFKELYAKIGGNEGRGWAEYGNRVPEGWQYTARAKVPGASYLCDVNAWRVNYAQLKTILTDTRQTG